MTLDQIQEFVTLADMRNYMKAADALFIAQSALSRHIQSLEKELDVQLFNRTTRSVELTEQGKIFLNYARKIVELQYQFRAEVYNHANCTFGTINVGCLPVSTPYHIPEILAKFGRENKNFHISLTGNDDVAQLINHTADFVFIRDTGLRYDNISLLPIDNDILAALLPDDHPLAGRHSVSLQELKDENFMLLPKGSQMYSLCVDSCIAAGFEPYISYTGPQATNMVALVREHIGIGLLTKKPLSYLDCRGISIVDIEPHIKTPICLAYLKGSPLSPGELHFINCVKSFLANQRDADENSVAEEKA